MRKYDVEKGINFVDGFSVSLPTFINLFLPLCTTSCESYRWRNIPTHTHVAWICQGSVITIAWPVLKDTDVAGSTSFVFGDDPVLGEGRNNDNHNAAAKCELGIFAACPRTILDLSLSPALLAGERGLLISPCRSVVPLNRFKRRYRQRDAFRICSLFSFYRLFLKKSGGISPSCAILPMRKYRIFLNRVLLFVPLLKSIIQVCVFVNII